MFNRTGPVPGLHGPEGDACRCFPIPDKNIPPCPIFPMSHEDNPLLKGCPLCISWPGHFLSLYITLGLVALPEGRFRVIPAVCRSSPTATRD